MGGTTSNSLPERLDEESLRALCGDKFKIHIFHQLAGDDGYVSKDAFLNYIQIRNDVALSTNTTHVMVKGAKDVFKAYAYPSTDNITCGRYLHLLRDLKWLNRKFSTHDATLLFDEKKTEGTSTMSYDTFIHDLLNDIAAKKEWSRDKLLKRLCAHDSQILADYANRETETSVGEGISPRPIKISSAAIADTDSPKVSSRPPSALEEMAAIKLQATLRQRSSCKLLNEIREVNNIAAAADICIVVDQPGDKEYEENLHSLFVNCCKPHSSMRFSNFLLLLRRLGMITPHFTSRDADITFKKIVTTALHPNAGTYADGVTLGKLINYQVFREIGIPIIAEKKSLDLSSMHLVLTEHLDNVHWQILEDCGGSIDQFEQSASLALDA